MSGVAKKECKLCDDMLIFCPGCTGGIAEEYGLFAPCGFHARCPFCFDMKLAREDVNFWKDFCCIRFPTSDDQRRLYNYRMYVFYHTFTEMDSRELRESKASNYNS